MKTFSFDTFAANGKFLKVVRVEAALRSEAKAIAGAMDGVAKAVCTSVA
jgi:hypothetical protein